MRRKKIFFKIDLQKTKSRLLKKLKLTSFHLYITHQVHITCQLKDAGKYFLVDEGH